MSMRFLLWLLMPHNARIRRRYMDAVNERFRIISDPVATVQRSDELEGVHRRQKELAFIVKTVRKIWKRQIPMAARWQYRMALLGDDLCTINRIEKRYGTRGC
jgi:hypothetical protein